MCLLNKILVSKLFHDNFMPNFGQLINCRIVYVTIICVENFYSRVNRVLLGITFISIKNVLLNDEKISIVKYQSIVL